MSGDRQLEDLDRHPVARAWLSRQQGSRPRRVELLEETKSSRVFVLVAAGPDGCDVIGKETTTDLALAESSVYERALPLVEVAVPDFLGTERLENPDASVVFLSSVGGVPYSPKIESHRELAARYLARLHTDGRRGELSSVLPLRTTDQYETMVRDSRTVLRAAVSSDAMNADESRRAEALLAQLDGLREGWDVIVAAATRMPPSFLHTDFLGRNVRVDEATGALTALDWAGAAWGPPCVDLGPAAIPMSGFSVDFDTASYLRDARAGFPELTKETLDLQVALGKILWNLVCVNGDIKGIGLSWHRRAVKNLSTYETEFRRARSRLTSSA